MSAPAWPCAAAVAALLLAGCAQQRPEAPAEPRFLFVQDADAGTAAPAGDGYLLLSLTGIDEETLWFMDRPDRHAGILPTRDFVAAWDDGNDSFARDPPNAAVLVHNATTGERDVYVVELGDPVFDEASRVLQYRARPLEPESAFLRAHAADARSGGRLPAVFGEVEVFIDSGTIPDAALDKASFCLIYDCIAADSGNLGAAAGDNHVCALMDDGSVKCWGRNEAGQLGD